MRLRQRDLQTVYLKKRILIKDKEANDVISYTQDAVELAMNIQAASGQVSATVYGQNLPYIKTCKYQGDQISEGKNELDGICLYVGKEQNPDYFIQAIQTFSTHLNITLKRMITDGD